MKRSFALTNLIALIASLPAHGTEAGAVPMPISKGDSYELARQKVMAAGWRPYIVQSRMADGTDERTWGDAKEMLLAGFNEIEMCTGTGANPCFFNFRIGNACARVETFGEYRKEFGSPKVIAWEITRCPGP